ncbi:MAG TPA: tetratricopeptide repeat protein [Pyrinomonadaceae bacterium]|nr:tetratricopeptide repeat protein [Pyrinomonadaceae bacterium]
MTDRPAPDETTPTSAKRGERGVAIGRDVTHSQIITGDHNVIQIQASATPLTALHQLRAPVGDFVGREHEINTLINALRRGSRACISGINGMAGIGKTELALLVADQLKDEYPDAQFFINLQGTDPNPRPAQEVLAGCIRAFVGLETKLPADLEELSQLYRSQLNGKRVLLLADNAGTSAQVRPLLPPTGSALLITSRQAIALQGMAPLTLNPLTAEEAQQLLLEIAPRAELVAHEICELCGYLPLAIRAAGGLLAITADLDPVDYAAQLKDARNCLQRIGTEGVEFGVEASFNLSYARLAPESERVFCLLSVFPDSFDAVAEEVVCVDTDHTQLSDLVRRSLVLYDSHTKRYRLHELARLFADSKLSAEERAAEQKRFAMHYQNVLATADKLYLQGGDSQLRGLALFDLEWANIQAGQQWVAAQEETADADVVRLGITYPQRGVYVLDLRRHSVELIRWQEIALAAARRLKDRIGECVALGNLGRAYADLGDTRRAIEFFEQSLLIQPELGDRRGEGNMLCNLGAVYADSGDSRRAIQFYEQALLLLRETGDRRGEGAVLDNLGTTYDELGESWRAIQFYEQALLLHRELGDRKGEGGVLGNLGIAYKNLGETRRAIEFYEQALLIQREIGDRRGEGNTLGNLGIGYANLGETRRAFQFFEQQLVIFCEIGDRRGEGSVLWNISLVLDQLGERAKAIQHAEQSLIIREQIEDPRAAQVRAKLATWRNETRRD